MIRIDDESRFLYEGIDRLGAGSDKTSETASLLEELVNDSSFLIYLTFLEDFAFLFSKSEILRLPSYIMPVYYGNSKFT